MSRIARVTQKIFASLASNNGVFGSAQDGSKVLTNDVSVLQGLPAYLSGWLSATLGASKFPTLEEIQALTYIETTQLAYVFQEGVPAYDVGTTYFTNSIVKKAGTFQLYGSLTNDNVGNALTDPTNWQLLGDLSQLVANVFTGGVTTGSANAQVLASLSPAAGFSLSNNGQTIICTAGFTNTGAATLAITSPAISATAIKKDSGSGLTPLTGGEITAGDTIYLSVNTAGACLVLTGGLALGTAASKAASDVTKNSVASVSGATIVNNFTSAADTVGTIKDSGFAAPSVLGAGVGFVGSSGSIGRATNVTSVTRTSGGHYDIVYTNALANGANSYISVGFTNPGSGLSWAITAQSTTGCSIQTYDLTGTATDPTYVSISVFAN